MLLGMSENQSWGLGTDVAHTLGMPAHTWCTHLLLPAVAGWKPTTVVALTQMEVTQWNLRHQTLSTVTKSLAGLVRQMPELGHFIRAHPGSLTDNNPLASNGGSDLLARYLLKGRQTSCKLSQHPIARFSMRGCSTFGSRVNSYPRSSFLALVLSLCIGKMTVKDAIPVFRTATVVRWAWRRATEDAFPFYFLRI